MEYNFSPSPKLFFFLSNSASFSSARSAAKGCMNFFSFSISRRRFSSSCASSTSCKANSSFLRHAAIWRRLNLSLSLPVPLVIRFSHVIFVVVFIPSICSASVCSTSTFSAFFGFSGTISCPVSCARAISTAANASSAARCISLKFSPSKAFMATTVL